MLNIPHKDKCKVFSLTKFDDLKSRLEGRLKSQKITVVVCGSFAREEASQESDLDFYVVYKGDRKKAEAARLVVREEAKRLSIKMPSEGGAFSKSESDCEMLDNIGGQKDNNEHLTRRMLFLLESKALYNQEFYNELQSNILNCYIKDQIKKQNICLFLLNDLIRYYRTICVDFEYKTSSKGKAWGNRNIKLIYSRKLLYFSGLVVVAKTANKEHTAKIATLKKYFDMSPVDRLKSICSGTDLDEVLKSYDRFIKEMSTAKTRKELNSIRSASQDSPKFRMLKDEGKKFSENLEKLLEVSFPNSHQIHHALKF